MMAIRLGPIYQDWRRNMLVLQHERTVQALISVSKSERSAVRERLWSGPEDHTPDALFAG